MLLYQLYTKSNSAPPALESDTLSHCGSHKSSDHSSMALTENNTIKINNYHL